MYRTLKEWFQRDAYGRFSLRVLVALGSAAVAVALSYLPYDTALQAIWVVVSSMFMGFLVLRQRLNESDQDRYRRLFSTRFTYLQNNDPEALTTIFAENIRPPVLEWFQSEYDVPIAEAQTVDAIGSLARSGDKPGQLIFRTGVELGRWLSECSDQGDRLAQLEDRLQQFVMKNEHLLGREIASGIFVRHIRRGEQRPAGVHMFHPRSRLLLAIEYYDSDSSRHAIALSARSNLFAGDDAVDWESFRQKVHSEFPQFQAAKGGSGPQNARIPYFVGPIVDTAVESDDDLKDRLLKIAALLPVVEGEGEGEGREAEDQKPAET
jgi:hypothetical protein